MSESYKKLIATLQAIFEMDKADLDFGIYRIMNQKRDEINRFLEEDLLPQVKQAFADIGAEGKEALQKELHEAVEQAKNFGAPDPENAPAVLEVKKKLSNVVDATALENDVFSKLHTFFSRYYDKGDFISQRRYKADTYAIPYEGEEVKLYWANHDQYYIKSSEHLRDYAFIAKDPSNNERLVRIKLVEADTEKDNIKAKSGEERRFVLDEENPLSIEGGELRIHFNFVPAGKQKQDVLNKKAVEAILGNKSEEYAEWIAILESLAPTEGNPNRTVLEKHLYDYTARNTFDYFIHKDLGGFLNRELDFYIKNEVIYLDDVDDGSLELVQSQFRKVRIIRSIAKKIIRMLAQIENFQKRIWLKKKFVIDSGYCISLGHLDISLYDEVFENEKQLDEWKALYGLEREELKSEYEKIGKQAFKDDRKYKFLVLDTANFEQKFIDSMLSSFENIDSMLDGELINADNFHGLSLVSAKYENRVKCTYIDPPYNTNSTPILYKNEYRDSSWMSLMANRVGLAKSLISPNGIKVIAIDDAELANLTKILDAAFPASRISKITVVHNPKGSITKDFNRVHEYAIFITPEDVKGCIARTLEENKTPRKMRRWGENSLRTDRKLSFYPIYLFDGKVVRVGEVPDDDFHPGQRNIHQDNGEVEVWPIDQNGIERRWNFGLDSIADNLDRVAAIEVDGTLDLFVTHEQTVPKTVWSGGEFDAGKYGNSLLIDLLGEKVFDFPKSINTVKNCIRLATSSNGNDVVLDYFAGSGTSAHAVIELNKSDSGNRKFVLVEMGKHFDSVIMPRIKKVAYTSTWNGGVPSDEVADGSLIFYRYCRLESYEDALNNLVLKSQDLIGKNKSLLEENYGVHEDYMLGYWIDFETQDSRSLLSLDAFETPFDYRLNVGVGSAGATQSKVVNLIETFNYLLGLAVTSIDVIRGFKVVSGVNPQGDSTLIVWRDIKEKDNSDLEEFLDKQGYNPKDTEFQHIYVNGDHTLEDPHSKVKMIEVEFKRLMFDVKVI